MARLRARRIAAGLNRVNVPSQNNGKRIPHATYRLQFHRDFTFRDAISILDYLRELGISDCYASPLFDARPESTHGYDVCCFDKINPRIGSEDDFQDFTKRLRELNFGLLLDIVPNHMAASVSNAWWRDMLEKGRDSEFAEFFDIDWQSPNPALHNNKVLLPVLGDDYGKVLESGQLKLAFDDGKFWITYYENRFPVDERTLPAEAQKNPRQFAETLSSARLHSLLQQQHYRLAYWRVAKEEINYRRFFDVTELAALKMERPEVFRATHELVFQLLKNGTVTGLRIDHPDGLWDPKEYLERLAELEPFIVVEKILSADEQLPDDWPADGTTGYDFLNRVNGLFVNLANETALTQLYHDFTREEPDFGEVAYRSKKKILSLSFRSELAALTRRLQAIAAHSRSGMDFPRAQLHDALEETIACFPVYRTYMTEETKSVSPAERSHIERAVNDAKNRNPQLDSTLFDFLRRVLLLELDKELDEASARNAREFVMKFQQLTGPAAAKGIEDTAFYNFNRLVSLNEVGGDPGAFGISVEAFHRGNLNHSARWPHTLLASATHDTKRGEDVRARINVLSEMPDEWRTAVTRWSQWNAEKKIRVNKTFAPSANDEYLLYQTLIGAWPENHQTENERLLSGLSGTLSSIRNGGEGWGQEALHTFISRISAFMLKAAKEAKRHTSWTEPNPDYENALRQFIEQTLADSRFVKDLRAFQQRVAFFGRFNSLAQTLLKITSPGVPDFYQGTELWDLNLVDPDNRRPVDYAVRLGLLAEIKQNFDAAENNPSQFFSELLTRGDSGEIKLFLVWRALNFRRTHRELFARGDYTPLTAIGPQANHLCAFTRTFAGRGVLVVVPRLVFTLTRGIETPPIGPELWRDTYLPLPGAPADGILHNVLTREKLAIAKQYGSPRLAMGEVLKTFPIALLKSSLVIPKFLSTEEKTENKVPLTSP